MQVHLCLSFNKKTAWEIYRSAKFVSMLRMFSFFFYSFVLKNISGASFTVVDVKLWVWNLLRVNKTKQKQSSLQCVQPTTVKSWKNFFSFVYSGQDGNYMIEFFLQATMEIRVSEMKNVFYFFIWLV